VTGQHAILETHLKKQIKMYYFDLGGGDGAKLIMPVGEWGIYIITVLMVTA
jgi:hypothetical protein